MSSDIPTKSGTVLDDSKIPASDNSNNIHPSELKPISMNHSRLGFVGQPGVAQSDFPINSGIALDDSKIAASSQNFAPRHYIPNQPSVLNSPTAYFAPNDTGMGTLLMAPTQFPRDSPSVFSAPTTLAFQHHRMYSNTLAPWQYESYPNFTPVTIKSETFGHSLYHSGSRALFLPNEKLDAIRYPDKCQVYELKCIRALGQTNTEEIDEYIWELGQEISKRNKEIAEVYSSITTRHTSGKATLDEEQRLLQIQFENAQRELAHEYEAHNLKKDLALKQVEEEVIRMNSRSAHIKKMKKLKDPKAIKHSELEGYHVEAMTARANWKRDVTEEIGEKLAFRSVECIYAVPKKFQVQILKEAHESKLFENPDYIRQMDKLRAQHFFGKFSFNHIYHSPNLNQQAINVLLAIIAGFTDKVLEYRNNCKRDCVFEATKGTEDPWKKFG